jgi:hypothetical protein
MAWMSGAQRQAQRDVAEVAMATLGAFVVDKPPPRIFFDSCSFNVIASASFGS